MAACRIYLFTYKRNHLLPRAIKSILDQTFTDWVCEVHNDAPEDPFPSAYVKALNDHRFISKDHTHNLGGVKSFNLAFNPCPESFATMLEDDNWWEPGFLQTMISELQQQKDIIVAVANEKIWKEETDGTWTDTNQNIWPSNSVYTLYDYRLSDKCGSAKICNSSMIWKTENAGDFLTPNDISIDVTEHFRERILPHPLLLVHTPLVNYAQTLQTNRSDGLTWSTYQALLISSVFVELDDDEKDHLADQLWERAREKESLYKTSLMYASLTHPAAFILFKKAHLTEIMKFALTCIRHPMASRKIISATKNLPGPWNFLLTAGSKINSPNSI